MTNGGVRWDGSWKLFAGMGVDSKGTEGFRSLSSDGYGFVCGTEVPATGSRHSTNE